MARIKVKLFGVFRIDTHTSELEVNADRVKDVFDVLNKELDGTRLDFGLQFKDAVAYLNGEPCPRKSTRLSDGDELWLLSPASGG